MIVTSTIKADMDGSLTFHCRCGRKAVVGTSHPDGTVDYVCKRGHGFVASIKIEQ